TAVGGNRLFHNEPACHGGRRFVDVTGKAGVGGPGGWAAAPNGAILGQKTILTLSSSPTFLGNDRDWRVGLIGCNYVTWSAVIDLEHPDPVAGLRTYGQPQGFKGAQCFLYHNLGDGRFEDVSESAGIRVSDADGQPVAKALGVVACDLDDDGYPD